MNFCSISYFIFLPVVVFLYWRLNGSARVWLLVLASYFFYVNWFPLYGWLLLGLSLVNWLIGILFSKAGRMSSKFLLFAGIMVNLGTLFYYKYASFFLINLNKLLVVSGTKFGLKGLSGLVPFNIVEVALPLGISFFAFEFIHYLVDVYRGSRPIESLPRFLAFAAFFPSQIAGPIKRFQDFECSRDCPEPWCADLFYEGGALIVQGTFKKMALADPLGMLLAPMFSAGANIHGLDALLATIGFSIQLFCDFSGYTDIGRGSALLMGIRLPENFDLPYLAPDILSFWRRWHKSLSNWLRDYVYIPLGGSRSSFVGSNKPWVGINLLLTMTVCGLWHGAQWHFIFFGIFNGLAMIINLQWLNAVARFRRLRYFADTKLGSALGYCLCVATWLSGWVIFRAPSMTQALRMFDSLIHHPGGSLLWAPLWRSGIVHMLCVYVAFWFTLEYVRKNQLTSGTVELFTARSRVLIFKQEVRLASWTVALLLIMGIRPVESIPFIYFQF